MGGGGYPGVMEGMDGAARSPAHKERGRPHQPIERFRTQARLGAALPPPPPTVRPSRPGGMGSDLRTAPGGSGRGRGPSPPPAPSLLILALLSSGLAAGLSGPGSTGAASAFVPHRLPPRRAASVIDGGLPSLAPSREGDGGSGTAGSGRGQRRLAQPRGRGDGGRGRGRGRGVRGGSGRGRGRGRGSGLGGGPQDPALAAAKALNREIIEAETAQEVLAIFAARGGARGLAGDGALNSVNYSTCLHRMARIASAFDPRGADAQEATRRAILSDPRFAIFLSSLAESMAGVDPSHPPEDAAGGAAGMGQATSASAFSSREFSNIAWAITKLKIAPPATVYPLTRSVEHWGKTKWAEAAAVAAGIRLDPSSAMVEDLVGTSLEVRAQVLEVARERSSLSDPAERARVPSRWIPLLSQLAGKLLDSIAATALDQLEGGRDSYAAQENANMLYALASAGRGDGRLFNRLAERLVEVTRLERTRPQQFSNGLWSLATAGVRGKGQRSLVRHVADVLDEDGGSFAAEFKCQELSNTAWAAATLLAKRGRGEGEEEEPPSGEGDGEGDSAEDGAVVRILRRVGSSLIDRVVEFKPQEISNTVWAMATVGFGSLDSSSNPYNGYIFLKSDMDRADKEMVATIVDVVARNAVGRLHKFRPQELNNLVWGLARLGHWDDVTMALFHGVGREILRRGRFFSPQDLTTCLWSFATMEYFDEEVYMAAASKLNRRHASSFRPQEASNCLWSIATASFSPKYVDVFDTTLVPAAERTSLDMIAGDPISESFATAASELMRRPNEFKEQEVKDILWAFSRCEVRHPTLFKMVAEHFVGPYGSADGGRGLEGFSPQGLGNLAWSFAKQAQLSFSVSEKKLGSSGRQAVYTTSCLDIGEGLVNKLFTRIAEEALCGTGGMDRFTGQDISNMCYSFATLGLLHNGFFESAKDLVIKRLSQHTAKVTMGGRQPPLVFKGQEVANLLWAYATLNVRYPDLVDTISDYTVAICSNGKAYDEESISKVFIRQEESMLAWACAVLEHYPAELMSLLYRGLLGSDGPSGAERLKTIYGDDGLQSQQVMILFYVQMALDLEAPDIGLSLPSNFPDAWLEHQHPRNRSTVGNKRNRNDASTTSMLNLNSSRLQTAVSRTLERIDFAHVEEHLIGAENIFSAQGNLNVASFPHEFLSIDIANIDEMIGIEVDGPAHFVNILDDSSDENAPLDIRSKVSGGKKMKQKGQQVGWKFLSNGRRSVNGPTSLKHRLLCHLGWCMIHCPWWEWNALGGDSKTEEQYCRELLEEVI